MAELWRNLFNNGDKIGASEIGYMENGKLKTVEEYVEERKKLGEIEYLYIPANTQTSFDVPPTTTKFFVFSGNADNNSTVILVNRFGSTGLVYHTIHNTGTTVTINTNADRTRIYFTTSHAVRGFVITAKA